MMDILANLSPFFEHYLTLERVHPSATYDYKARGMYALPVFECSLHRPKCAPGSWTYVAVKAAANLARLADADRLYVGSQTVDRMFRGDQMAGKNFHHAQMRKGNGQDTPETYLGAGNRIDIHRLSADKLASALIRIPELARLRPLLNRPAKHAGYWLEQCLLAIHPQRWRWNTAGAAAETANFISRASNV